MRELLLDSVMDSQTSTRWTVVNDGGNAPFTEPMARDQEYVVGGLLMSHRNITLLGNYRSIRGLGG